MRIFKPSYTYNGEQCRTAKWHIEFRDHRGILLPESRCTPRGLLESKAKADGDFARNAHQQEVIDSRHMKRKPVWEVFRIE